MLHLESVSYQLNNRQLFGDISLSLKTHEKLYIKGKNGSGKSTLLKLIAGLKKPTNGTINTQGTVHYIGHVLGLPNPITIDELCDFWQLHYNVKKQTIKNTLSDLSLSISDVYVHELSQGQQQKLAIAKLWFAPRDIWLLDEITTNLDTTSRAIAEQCIDNHQGIVAFTSHHSPSFTPTQELAL